MLTGHIDHPAIIYLHGFNSLLKGLNRTKDLTAEVLDEAKDYYGKDTYIIKIIS